MNKIQFIRFIKSERFHYKFLLFVMSLLLYNFLNAQTIHTLKTLTANQFGQEQGLLQLNVKGMTLDNLGYLWVGTEDGLHRFNGYDFKLYIHNPNDSTSIKDDHIRSLFFTNDTLWIATNSNGIAGFIPSKNKFFYPFENSSNPELNTSYKILNDTKNSILIAVKNNLIIFNRQSKSSKIIPLPKTKMENNVTDVLQIDADNCLLATTASGILELNKLTFTLSETDLIKNKDIQCFYNEENNIYLGTKEGLFVYNLATKTINKTALTQSIKCFYKLENNQFYIGTDNGLFLYDLKEAGITPISLQTGENIVYKAFDINQIIGDKKGNLWIGTEGDGLFHYNVFQKKFNTIKLGLKEFPSINNISTFQFLKGKDSTLWLGSKYGMVNYSFNTKRFKFYDSKEKPLIYALINDHNNTIWAGGFTSGLLKYDPISDRFIEITGNKSSLPDKDVVEIIPIDSTTLWICTWAGGIHKFNTIDETFEELLINGERLNRVRISLKDSKGNIWLGTDQGAYCIEPNEEIKKYHAEDGSEQKLSGDRIFSIKEDQLGNIWLGTNVGLTKLDKMHRTTALFYEQKGLPNDFIYSILIDKNNNIWVSTNYGISVLNQQTNTFSNYTTSDGLQNIEFNGKAGYQDKYGNFYFGGISGINIFKPEEISENKHLPKIYIESVELFNGQIKQNELYKDSLRFKSRENVLTFNFAALNFVNPEKCDYQYQMVGFDKNWRPVTKNRSTTYTNLNPGDYVFKVRASNDAGVWNPEIKTLAIEIVPPWYFTWWFQSGFIFVFLLSGILFYLYKTQKLVKDKVKLEELIALRTQDVKDKNRALQTSFREAETQRDNIRFLMQEHRHRVKNNLQIISSLLNIQASTLKNKEAAEALKMARTRISAIAQIENKLSKDTEEIQIDRFIKELCNTIIKTLSDDDNLKYTVIYDLQEAKIKNLNSTLIGLILNELLTNATKYAFDRYDEKNKLNISCNIQNKYLMLTIDDNGKGYSVEKVSQKNSLGIELVKEMVEQLNGTIQISTEKGTKNEITIPINT